MDNWYQKAFGEYYKIVYKHRSNDEADAFVQNLISKKIKPHSKVLDIGCGGGRHVDSFKKRGLTTFGVDLSIYLLRQASDTSVLCLGDMRRLPFIDNYFDYCCSLFTSFGYFENIEEHLQLLKEWQSKLKIGGELIIDYFNPNLVYLNDGIESTKNVDNFVVKEKRWIEKDRINKNVEIYENGILADKYIESVLIINEESFINLLKSAGFKNISLFDENFNNFDNTNSKRLVLISQKNA